jgi:drug/metabolite transporter (DMT)-like permease
MAMRLHPLDATLVRLAAGAAGAWALALFAREGRRTLAALRDRRATAFLVAGALAGPVTGVTLSLLALQYIDAGVAASITACSPILALLIAWRFHGERLSWRVSAGALVAVAGVVVLFQR